ncbi:thioredoxin domain-containing protein [Deinococcus multiflagellatus]|uniref:Thioredoxin domain-containing protein n=1 Tax=Deinococcus multiflagellatus TaxID=1656887 RepID=A0ABW1ZMI0_9DEIO|nr:thioredoxin domain-containing protein [Deinococcus multiflagellatus]MBZ9712384.1 DsbA family protein [Deinococcus multiflagellatus]
MASREAQLVQAEVRRSQAKGVQATPSFAVNGQLISWDGVEDIEAMVQKTLAIARKAAQQAK